MDIFLMIKALMMGVVEGFSEFLPISSTGYLILSADVMDFWDKEKRDLFIVFIQLGAILAVIYGYWGRLWGAFLGLLTGKSNGMSDNPRQLGVSLMVATVPVMLIGFTLADYITEHLFSPIVVAIMLIVGALLIFYVESRPKFITAQIAEAITPKTALLIGLCQCLALIPGTSRSGATIISALYLRASRTAATEFSFFLGIPVLVGAALLGFVKHKAVLQTYEDWVILLIGTVVSFVVALLCIRFMVAWVAKYDFRVFAWLRLTTGMIVLIAYFGFDYHMAG